MRTTAIGSSGRRRIATRQLRDRVATALMLLGVIGALYSFVASIGVVLVADSATQQVEAWRMLGFAFFAGTMSLLAFWPRRYPGLWELLIVNKAALTVVEVLLIHNHATNAQSTAIADGVLSIVLLTAYITSRGYSSWADSMSASHFHALFMDVPARSPLK